MTVSQVSIQGNCIDIWVGCVCVCVLSFFNLSLKWWLSRRGWVLAGCWGNPRDGLWAPPHPSEPLVDLRSCDYPGLSCCAKHSVDWPRTRWQLATADRSFSSSLFFPLSLFFSFSIILSSPLPLFLSASISQMRNPGCAEFSHILALSICGNHGY